LFKQKLREIVSVTGSSSSEETIGNRNKYEVRFRLEDGEEYEAWLTEGENGRYFITSLMYAEPTGRILESDVVSDHDKVTQWSEEEMDYLEQLLMEKLELPLAGEEADQK
jgi:hypothetical protein